MATSVKSDPRERGATIAALPLLLRPEDVARELGINRATVYAKLITPRILPSVLIGKSRRVARADLEEYVERLRREASGGPPAA